MKAEIINGNLVVTVPLRKPTPSKSGKTLIVATSGGLKPSGVIVDGGKEIIVGLNAFIKKD